MAQITFYRQKRWDGGIHTGLATEHGTVLEQHQHGKGISDPALLWFVDVRAKGRSLPHDVEGIRKWFLHHADLVTNELRNLSDELTAGIDFNCLPLERRVAGAPRGVRV